MRNFRLCTFGQAMVQTPGSAVWGTSDLKDLRIVSGQTMVQKWPNDGSSHISRLQERQRQIVELYHQQKCYRQHFLRYVILFVMCYCLPFAVVP